MTRARATLSLVVLSVATSLSAPASATQCVKTLVRVEPSAGDLIPFGLVVGVALFAVLRRREVPRSRLIAAYVVPQLLTAGVGALALPWPAAMEATVFSALLAAIPIVVSLLRPSPKGWIAWGIAALLSLMSVAIAASYLAGEQQRYTLDCDAMHYSNVTF